MNLELRGKNALIAGATRGIGLQIAKELAAEGANIGICARAEEDVAAVLRQFKNYDIKAVGSACNIKNPDSYTKVLEKLKLRK